MAWERSSWKRGPSLSKESRGMMSDSIGKKAVFVVAVLVVQWAMEVAKLAAKAAGASASESRERMPQPPSPMVEQGVAGGVR